LEQRPIVSVLGITMNDKNEMLLVKQKTLPLRGWWLLPGGHVRFGETIKDAIVREVREETGLQVRVSKLLGVFDVIDENGEYHYITVVFQCKLTGGQIKAGSDAVDVGWFNIDKVDEIQQDLKRILKATGFLSR